MMKILKTVVIGIFLLFILGAFIRKPEDNRLAEILSKLERYVLSRPQEKLYLHIDKTLYTAGEDIWFRAYLVNAFTHRPDSISRTVYVELFDQANKLLQRKVLYSPAGVSNGDFHLADDAKQGAYTIRAYTNYMKNVDGNFFFTKEISVVNLSENASDISSATNVIDLQFFPEGGDLLNDVENKLAFKAVNNTGKSIPIEGHISDETGKVITSFKSEHDGMGSFTIRPSGNHHYTAKIKDSDYSFALPEVIAKGYMLRVTETNSEIQITVYSNLKKSAPIVVYLVAQSHGALCYAARGEILNTALTKVPKYKFPTGIIQITLFDGAGVPQCERLFFINHQNELTVSIKPDQVKYGKKQAIAIDVDVKRKNDVVTKGNFSISIFDNSRISDEVYPGTIVNNLWLTSDLKWQIENPGYYLKDTLAETRHHLDLLMMTHGWRRFSWKTILQDAPDPIKYYAEKGIVISGTVQKALSKKPSMNSKVKIFSETKDILILKTDSLGRFYTDELSFYDSTQLMFQTDNAKGRQTDLQFNLNPFNVPPEMKWLYMASAPDYFNRLAEKVRASNTALLPIKTTILKEVEVRATKTEENQIRAFKLYGTPGATLTSKDIPSGYNNILQAIQGKLSGVMVTGGNISIRGGGTPSFLLDGMPVDVGMILSIPINSIELIDILKNSGNGVIAVYTKRGYVSSTPTVGIHNVKYPGFYRAREFYSPNYHAADSKKDSVDVRSTLYWNPNIKINAGGKAHIHFFTSDASASYKIIVEGILDDGTPGYGSQEFTVH